MSVKSGPQYYLFLGESGAGKSTAVEIFCGVKNISSSGISSKTKKVLEYKSKDSTQISFIDTAGFNDTDDDDGIHLDDIVDTCREYPYLTNVCIFFADKRRFDKPTQDSILKFLELLGYPQQTKLVICVTGLPEGHAGEDKFDEYQGRIHRLLSPKKMQFEFVSVPSVSSLGAYENLFSKLQDNRENIQPKFLNKVRTVDSVIQEYTSEISQLREKMTQFSADTSMVQALQKEIASLKEQQSKVSSSPGTFVASFQENRCHGITLKGIRCKNTLRCPHH